jgi:hypothetical protein
MLGYFSLVGQLRVSLADEILTKNRNSNNKTRNNSI